LVSFNVTLNEYEGAHHAFALKGGHNYDAAAARRANQLSKAFLAAHLKSA
jgi:dienelactone hydrolase